MVPQPTRRGRTSRLISEATAKPVVHKVVPVVQQQPTAALGALPGVIAGFLSGLIFTTMATSTPLNSAENVMITGVCSFMVAGAFGAIAYFFGRLLFRNELAGSTTRLFDGSMTSAGVVHCVLWVVIFFVANGLLIGLNPDQLSLVRERVNVLTNSQPELPPIPIPSSPSSGRHSGPRSLAEASKDDDPNRVKSSPSRYDSRRANLSPAQEAEQQAKRDAVVVDVLKNAGFKLETANEAKP